MEKNNNKQAHSCKDCAHLITNQNFDKCCKKKIGKTSRFDRRFPYESTSCKEFQKQSRER